MFSQQADYFFPLVLGTWLPGWSGLVVLVVEFVEVRDLFKQESDCFDLEGSEMLFLQICVFEDAILKFEGCLCLWGGRLEAALVAELSGLDEAGEERGFEGTGAAAEVQRDDRVDLAEGATQTGVVVVLHRVVAPVELSGDLDPLVALEVVQGN